MTDKVLDMINEQLNFELESAYIYEAMEVYADSLDLDGFTHWLSVQVDEEVEHAQGMKRFLQSVGYRPTYKAIAQPKAEYEDVLDVMKSALEHEKKVTARIKDIAKAAREAGEERVISFIKWYIDEQVEEEENFSKLITRLERIIHDWPSIYVMDAELASRAAATPVPENNN